MQLGLRQGGFDGLNQFELCPTAIEVMGRAMDAKVGIAAEVIGQKAKADFKGD